MKTITRGVKDDKLLFIDNLRGIAILMVITRHAFSSNMNLDTPVEILSYYGQMGVQLFFIVSAFTLCLSMDKRSNSNETLTTFYLRRFFRIAPLYYFGILLYLFYHSVIEPLAIGASPGIEKQYTVSNVFANLVFLHDFYPGGASKVVAGGWSIGTETTFYALFPFIFYLYLKFQNSDRALLIIPLAGLIGSLAAIYALEYFATQVFHYDNFWYLNRKDGFLYFNIICQLPVFLLGMSLYFRLKRVGPYTLRDKWGAFLSMIGFTTIAVIIFFYFNKQISLIPFVSGIAFLFLFVLYKEVPLLSNRFIGRIGQLSYSMYLFHFIFAWQGLRILYTQFGHVVDHNLLLAINVLVTTALTVVVAIFSEKYIEKPGIALGRYVIRKIKSRRVVTDYEPDARPAYTH